MWGFAASPSTTSTPRARSHGRCGGPSGLACLSDQLVAYTSLRGPVPKTTLNSPFRSSVVLLSALLLLNVLCPRLRLGPKHDSSQTRDRRETKAPERANRSTALDAIQTPLQRHPTGQAPRRPAPTFAQKPAPPRRAPTQQSHHEPYQAMMIRSPIPVPATLHYASETSPIATPKAVAPTTRVPTSLPAEAPTIGPLDHRTRQGSA